MLAHVSRLTRRPSWSLTRVQTQDDLDPGGEIIAISAGPTFVIIRVKATPFKATYKT
jgi:hypothetical protein